MRYPKDIIINGEQLSKILEENRKWCFSDGGKRADLRDANLGDADLGNADLRNADLSNACLSNAYLGNANLSNAYLSNAYLGNADLRNADLSNACLSNAYLRNANLGDANLRYANLGNADLRDANLRDANLRYANLNNACLNGEIKGIEAVFAVTSIVPEVGAFVGFKVCNDGIIVKLQIPARAKRSNATGRKCRAEYVKDLGHWDKEGNMLPNDHIAVTNTHGPKTEYRKGKTIRCDKWDDNRWNICSGGIHFFLTRWEAENWQ